MPAAEAGLKAGDQILAIDTTNVSSLTNDKVSELLKGVPNSKMTLTIQRPGKRNPESLISFVNRFKLIRLRGMACVVTVSVTSI